MVPDARWLAAKDMALLGPGITAFADVVEDGEDCQP
jgi:hypothetical protein